MMLMMMVTTIMMMTTTIVMMTVTINDYDGGNHDITMIYVGGTGKTGKFGVKGALQRGHNVRILARNPDKVETRTFTS